MFIAVDNFYKKQGEKTLIHDINYQKHFQNLERIADESKEIDDKATWISSARENLRARLELDENQTYSEAIKQKTSDPIFHKNAPLNQKQIGDFNSRLSPYSQSNKKGCGTLQEKIGDEDVSYPFCHFRITHDPIAKKNNSDSNKVKLIDENEYLKHPPITAICIDYPDYRSQPNLPSSENLTKTYKQKTLETLTLYNNLEVDHLVKHGDGMGVFLNQTQINGRQKDREDKTISYAMKAYLDGFFQAVSEFYQTNPNATLKKITFVTLDGKLEKIFNEKLKEFKKDTSNSEILKKVEFKEDKAGPRFNSSKYYEQGTKKLGMTIAPNGDQKFLGGALNEGNVLEEQIALLSDMASIGNPNFNPNVKKIIDLKSLKTSGTPSTTLDISDNYKKTDYEFSDDSKTFYHKEGHIDGMRIIFNETIPKDESRRKAGAHHQSGKEHFEVLNDILESVCESANEAGIHDKEKIKEILISAMKKATVKNDKSSDKFSKKFSTHFQNKCKEKKIFLHKIKKMA